MEQPKPIIKIRSQIDSDYHGQRPIITEIYEDKIVISCMPQVICTKNDEGKLNCKYEGANLKNYNDLTENHDDLTEAIKSYYCISPPQGIAGFIENLWDQLNKGEMEKDQIEKEIHDLWDWVNKNSEPIC